MYSWSWLLLCMHSCFPGMLCVHCDKLLWRRRHVSPLVSSSSWSITDAKVHPFFIHPSWFSSLFIVWYWWCRAEFIRKSKGKFLPEEVMSLQGCSKVLHNTYQNFKMNFPLFFLQTLRKWMTQLLQAVDYLHFNRVIHRDLKVCMPLSAFSWRNILANV